MPYLTSETLLTNLTNLAVSSSEVDRSLKLGVTARLIQTAVHDGTLGVAFEAAIQSVPSDFQALLREVVNCSVDLQIQNDGSSLGFWLLPVMAGVTGAMMPAVLPLETTTTSWQMLTALLRKQLADACEVPGSVLDANTGWTYTLPTLYSLEQITAADLHSLIALPVQVQQFIRGDRRSVTFDCGGDSPAVAGERLYFLPLIVRCPAGVSMELPESSDYLTARFAAWVRNSLQKNNRGAEVVIRACDMPRPFSVALEVGENFRLDTQLRTLLSNVCSSIDTPMAGLTAHVAPYTVEGDSRSVMGLTLASRLTSEVLATLVVPAAGNGAQEANVAARTLYELGLLSVQVHLEPVGDLFATSGLHKFGAPSKRLISCGLHEMVTTTQ